MTLNAIAIDVILNPYENIDYQNISVFELSNESTNKDDCCYQENYYGQSLKDW
jgi:hypothetical protein